MEEEEAAEEAAEEGGRRKFLLSTSSALVVHFLQLCGTSLALFSSKLAYTLPLRALSSTP